MIKPSLTLFNNPTLVNLLGFNAAWFGLILLGNIFIPLAAIMLLLHLYYQADKSELVLIFIVAGVGVLLDSALIYSGIFIFPDSTQLPLWLITLWFCFAATVRHSLSFLAKFKILQVLAGGVFAPLSYLAGAKFSVVYITPSFELSYLLLGCLWGPLMLLVFAISGWLQIEEKKHVTQL